MKCHRCGKELEGGAKCIFCGYENSEGNVREMTSAEKNFYNGVTIESGENFKNENFNQSGRKFRADRIHINLGNGGIFSSLLGKFIGGLMNNSLLAKIAAILIGIAFAALMFFIALPILFFVLALGIALFIYAKFTGKF